MSVCERLKFTVKSWRRFCLRPTLVRHCVRRAHDSSSSPSVHVFYTFPQSFFMLEPSFTYHFIIVCAAESPESSNNNQLATAMTVMQSTSGASQANLLKVERPYYEQEQFNNDLKYCQPDVDKTSFCNRLTNVRLGKIITNVFPVFSWLPNYNLKHDLIGDIVSGCTVAVMHIPQGRFCSILFNEFQK